MTELLADSLLNDTYTIITNRDNLVEYTEIEDDLTEIEKIANTKIREQLLRNTTKNNKNSENNINLYYKKLLLQNDDFNKLFIRLYHRLNPNIINTKNTKNTKNTINTIKNHKILLECIEYIKDILKVFPHVRGNTIINENDIPNLNSLELMEKYMADYKIKNDNAIIIDTFVS
jgi:hypothetical protein